MWEGKGSEDDNSKQNRDKSTTSSESPSHLTP